MSFKVIYRVDATPQSARAITWEAGCPLAFEALQVSRNVESGAAFLQARVRNVSNELVSSFRATLTVTYEDGAEERFGVHPLDADIADGGTYDFNPIQLSRGDVSSAKGQVEEARRASCTWQTADAATTLPDCPQLDTLTEAQMQERVLSIRELDADITPGKEEEHGVYRTDTWWRCICGQVNVGRAACCGCRADLSHLLALEDPQTLDARAAERSVREAQKAEAETKQKAQRNKQLKYAAIVGAALLVVVVVFSVVKSLLGANAVWLLAEKNYHDSDGDVATTTYEYKSNGALSKRITTDSDDETTVYTYTTDDFGMVKTTYIDGEKSSENTVEETDDKGRPTSVTTTHYADDEDDESSTSTTTFSYTDEGQLKREDGEYSSGNHIWSGYGAGGRLVDYGYGFSVLGTDYSTQYVYTYALKDDRATSVTAEVKSYVDGYRDETETTDYDIEYDGNGNVSKVTNTDDDSYVEYTYKKINNPCGWAIAMGKLFAAGDQFF